MVREERGVKVERKRKGRARVTRVREERGVQGKVKLCHVPCKGERNEAYKAMSTSVGLARVRAYYSIYHSTQSRERRRKRAREQRAESRELRSEIREQRAERREQRAKRAES
jgi:hypothetical protein